MKKVSKLFGFLSLLLIVSIIAAACSSDDAKKPADSSTGGKEESSSSDVRTIKFATSGAPKPFTYVDESNEVQGYDIDILKAVFEKLPQYKLEIEVTEFKSVTSGILSGLYQGGANNFAYNDERAANFTYTDPIFKNQFVIAVPKGEKSITGFESLAGKKTLVNPGVNYTTALEKYNEQHADQASTIEYTEADVSVGLQRLSEKAIDFVLIDAALLKIYEESYNFELDAIPLSKEDSEKIAENSFSYFLVSKGEEQLTKDINSALATLIEDGTISELSKKHFGADYAPTKE